MLGRPTKYTQELAAKICERIASGDSLRTICKDEGFPSKSTVLKWIFQDNNKEFSDQYDKARGIQAELLADEIFDIADDGQNDWMEKTYSDGSVYTTLNAEAIGRSRLRVDSRKWYLSKVLPKVYGEKIEHSGPGGGPFIIEVVKFADT